VDEVEDLHDFTDRIKFLIKRFPRFYYFLVDVFSPVLGNTLASRCIQETRGNVCINLGSGNSRVADHVINVDMFDYDQVDIVVDIHQLPFRDDSLDMVLDIAVLEHVREPGQIVAEALRVLRPGGRIFSVIPFMQPFHALPHDYQRYSLRGIEHLHQGFQQMESGVFGGPVSGFTWMLQEFLALLFSLGGKPLRDVLALFFMALLWPLKYLDLYFRRLSSADNLASSFYFLGEKRPRHPSKGEDKWITPCESMGDLRYKPSVRNLK
jgi:SAM-dependent methyltransferase